jgi:hypothetical protein
MWVVPPQDEKEDHTTAPDGSNGSVGFSGLVRSFLQNFIRRVASGKSFCTAVVFLCIPLLFPISAVNSSPYITAPLGSIPRVRPASIAKGAGNLDFVIEVYQHAKDRLNLWTLTKSLPSYIRGFPSFIKSSVPWARSFLLLWAPSLLKSSVLGSVLFMTYDSLYDSVRSYLPSQTDNRTPGSSLTNSTSALIAGAAVGACGGIVHGSLSLLWNATVSLIIRFGNRKHSQPQSIVESKVHSLPGTLVSHTLVHLTLFSTYEMTKTAGLSVVHGEQLTPFSDTDRPLPSLPDPNVHKSELIGQEAFAILLAGGVSGVVAEAAQHYLAPLEYIAVKKQQILPGDAKMYTSKQDGGIVRATLLEMRNSLRSSMRTTPALRNVLSAALPSAIGFLAYEYGKQLYD